MGKIIALCCRDNNVKTIDTLEKLAQVEVFSDGLEMAYYLRNAKDCGLAVVAVDGKEGLNYCNFVRGQNDMVPILWISDNEDFEQEASKIPVNDFWVKPMPQMLLKKSAAALLERYNKDRMQRR